MREVVFLIRVVFICRWLGGGSSLFDPRCFCSNGWEVELSCRYDMLSMPLNLSCSCDLFVA